jgi:hypothetical protein
MSESRPLISLIVPVYNVEKFLTQCIESLLTQSYKNFEIILVDDGSTDRSGNICEHYAAAHETVHVYHKPNGGLSSARNFGMNYAKGTYTLFVDSDDTIERDTLSACIPHIINEDGQNDCVVFTYSLVDEGGKNPMVDAESSTFPVDTRLSGMQAMELLLQDKIQNFSWRILFKRKLWYENNISFPEGRLFEDVLTTYLFFLHAKYVFFLNKRLYNYRQRRGSILHTVDSNSATESQNAFLERSETIACIAPELQPYCIAQKHKAHYRVAMWLCCSDFLNADTGSILNEAIQYLHHTVPDAATLSIYNRKQRVALNFFRFVPPNLAIWCIRRGKRIQYYVRKIRK